MEKVDLVEFVKNSTGGSVLPNAFIRVFMASNRFVQAVRGGLKNTLFYGRVDVSKIVANGGADALVFRLKNEVVRVVDDADTDAPSDILFDSVEMIGSGQGTVAVGAVAVSGSVLVGGATPVTNLPFYNYYPTGLTVVVDGVSHVVAAGGSQAYDVKNDGSSVINVAGVGTYRLARKINGVVGDYPNNTAYNTLNAFGTDCSLYTPAGITAYEIMIP